MPQKLNSIDAPLNLADAALGCPALATQADRAGVSTRTETAQTTPANVGTEHDAKPSSRHSRLVRPRLVRLKSRESFDWETRPADRKEAMTADPSTTTPVPDHLAERDGWAVNILAICGALLILASILYLAVDVVVWF